MRLLHYSETDSLYIHHASRHLDLATVHAGAIAVERRGARAS